MLTGYDDSGRQVIAVPSLEEPGVVDVYVRETAISEAIREERIARKARRRSLKAIKASIRNLPADDAAACGSGRKSARAQTEDRAREALSRLPPIPAGGDDIADI